MSNFSTKEPITIFEHSRENDTGIKFEELNEKDKIILEKLKDKNKINYSYTGGSESSLQITTTSFIGSMSLEGPNRRINILPKIFKNTKSSIEDINLFLDYANNGFNYFENAKHFYNKTPEHTLLNPLHQTLIVEYQNLIKKGLLKSYVIHAENTSSMRGKLSMQQQIHNDSMLRPTFFCEFDELEYDSIENRIILQALSVVERTSDDQNMRMKSLDFAQRLSGLVQKTIVPRTERQRMMQSYNRQNRRYEYIHKICDQVIDQSGIQDIYSGNYSYVIPVFYDMNELFENFIQNLFEQCFDESSLMVKTQLTKPAWRGEGELGPRRMKPDITIWDGKICKQIIDVKYKTDNISAGDLYQLGFYMHEFSELNPKKEQIKHAIAITPEYPGAGSGIYESQTEMQVFVKRINIQTCLNLIKSKQIPELNEQVKNWMSII